MTGTRRAAAAALILALAIAAPVAADSSTSEVDETLVLASTIAATVPANITYTPNVPAGAGYYVAPLAITDVETDYPTGLSVKLTATTLVGPGATIPLTDRQFEYVGPAGSFTRTPVLYGTSAITGLTIASTGAPLVGGSLDIDAQVRNVTVPGTYSGTLTLTFETN